MWKLGFFHIRDPRKAGSFPQLLFQEHEGLPGALRHHLDPSVGEVAGPATDAQPLSVLESEPPEPYSLHDPRDQPAGLGVSTGHLRNSLQTAGSLGARSALSLAVNVNTDDGH